MNILPYVGVTGFMSRAEVDSALEVVPKNAARKLMPGVLASSKTLVGMKNKWPGRYPPIEKISEIFTNDPRALNLIHYSTDNKYLLLDQLLYLKAIVGKSLNGFQLNIAWPPIPEIGNYLTLHPEDVIVLQIGKKAFDAVENSPEKLAKKILEYSDYIDYVLLDPSGGLGQPFNVETALSYVSALKDKINLGIGVAGGLSKDNIACLGPLVNIYNKLSIDAEGKLRSPQPEDALDIKKTRGYIKKAFQFFNSMGA